MVMMYDNMIQKQLAADANVGQMKSKMEALAEQLANEAQTAQELRCGLTARKEEFENEVC